MNYRHIYHAGNFADVIKHLIQMLALDHLAQKDKPFFVLDTHGGIGIYDLDRAEAQKTAEAAEGIGRLWNAPDLPLLLARYVDMVRAVNRGPDKRNMALRTYPGSPLITQALMRENDFFVVNELHPEDHETLARTLGRDRRIRVENRDGYECLRALLPPPQRRGLVLVDPPFEVRDEFKRMVRGLKDAHRRWANGTYLLWYPIKDPAHIAAFHADLIALGIPDMIAVDFYRRPSADVEKLNGSGMIIVNPPWTLRAALADLLPVLVTRLTAGQGHHKITVLAEE